MKIRSFVAAKESFTFSNLEQGDVFLRYNALYIKATPDRGGLAVHLRTGTQCRMEPTDEVFFIKGEFVIDPEQFLPATFPKDF